MHFVHLEFDEGHEGYVFFSVCYVKARVSRSSSKISCLKFVAVFPTRLMRTSLCKPEISLQKRHVHHSHLSIGVVAVNQQP